ncbi:inosose dehydratase [Luteipulveratus mongoliensis]|uniref:Inosose dehydratase n=2 Tax=Luteipulveratus mongoliensis TaxID=571913 RepID=A0A0K1JQE0_9MICO|nr:inosose dehydratase [Luteipulveratus mongoliensis]
MSRVAGAPISWGVSEVEGWGVQLPTETVLSAMYESGLTATELGPAGFLPTDPDQLKADLDKHSLRAVAQFVPVVLHDESTDPRPDVRTAIASLSAVGATTLVLAAATGGQGYDDRPAWTSAAWSRALGLLDDLAGLGREAGLDAVLHPHVGTMIENEAEVERVLDGCGIGLCLDTGHLLIGGADPVALARAHADRIRHVHLKDVRLDLAEQVRTGAVSYSDAVERGIYAPIGDGDVEINRIVKDLENQGYSGWYVLEQDTVLGSESANTATADVRTSLRALSRIAEGLEVRR